MNFALLEEQLRLMAIGLISTSDQKLGRIVTAELSFRNVVALVSSLCAHRYDGPANEYMRLGVDAVLTDALAVEQRRNAVTHSNWWPSTAPDSRIRLKITARKRAGLVHHLEPMSARDLEEIALQAKVVQVEAGRLSGNIWRDMRDSGASAASRGGRG